MALYAGKPRSMKTAVSTPNKGMERLTPTQGTKQRGIGATNKGKPAHRTLKAKGGANVSQGGSKTIQTGISRTNLGRKNL